MEDLPILAISDARSVEGNGNTDGRVAFEITLSAPASADVTFTAQTISGTAEERDDFRAIDTDLFTIPAGETSTTFTVRATRNAGPEGDENFFVELANLTGAKFAGGGLTETAMGIIEDDDGENRPALFVTDPEVVEGGDGREAVFEVILSRPFDTAIELPYRTVSDTASDGGDFAPREGVLGFAAGETRKTVTVPITGDGEIEATERFHLAVDPAGLDLVNGAQAAVGTATILDDDAGGGVQPVLSVLDARTAEGNGNTDGFAQFEIRLSAPSSTDVTFDAETVSGTAEERDDFRTIDPQSFTIPAGQTSFVFSVRANRNAGQEGDESFALRLSNLDGAAFEGGALETSATGILLDDDGETRPAVFVADTVVVEGGAGERQAVFDVTLSRPFAEAVAIPFTTVSGGARAGDDFTAQSGTLSFAPGQTENSVAVAILGDAEIEPSERFDLVLDLEGLDLAGGAAAAAGTATILDDDAGGGFQPVLSVGPARAAEGNGNTDGRVQFEIRLSAPSSSDISFVAETVSGSAEERFDFRAIDPEVFTIPAGETSLTFSVRANRNAGQEGDEDFALRLTNVSGAVFEGGARELQATGILNDDDGETRPAIFVEDTKVVEEADGLAEVQIGVSLSRPLDETVTVAYTTAPAEGADLQDLAGRTGTLTFLPGQVEQTVAFSVRGDTAIEATEAIDLILSRPEGADFVDGAGGARGRVAILDDDAGGGTLPVLSISDARANEGNGNTDGRVQFEISLSAPSASDVTYTAETVGGTAVDGDDYRNIAPEVFVIPAGETSQTFSVRANRNAGAEPDEDFTLRLTDPAGAVFAGGELSLEATGIIADDDATEPNLVPLVVEDIRIEEPASGSATASFTIRSPVPAGLTITGDYAIFGGTAAEGADFAPESGTFSIPGGQTSTTVSVPVFADDAAEAVESVVLRLDNVLNAGTGTSSGEIHAIGWIDDGPFAEPDAADAETRATVVFDPLPNDRTVDGGPLSVTAVERPANGFAAVLEDGQLLYRSAPGFAGTDTIRYTLNDGAGGTDTGVATVTVAEPAPGDGLTVAEAQRVAYLYEAALDRDGDIDLPGLNFWIDAREGEDGFSIVEVAGFFLDNPEFRAAFGEALDPTAPDYLDDFALVTALYENVLDREADEAGRDFWLSVLERPDVDRAQLVLFFADSPENLTGSAFIADLEEVTPGDWAFA